MAYVHCIALALRECLAYIYVRRGKMPSEPYEMKKANKQIKKKELRPRVYHAPVVIVVFVQFDLHCSIFHSYIYHYVHHRYDCFFHLGLLASAMWCKKWITNQNYIPMTNVHTKHVQNNDENKREREPIWKKNCHMPLLFLSSFFLRNLIIVLR